MASREGLSAGMAILLGVSAFNIGNLFGRLANDGDERVKDVQAHNAHVLEQLGTDYPDLQELVLDDESENYTFAFIPEGEMPQVCEGEYDVSDGIAQITGSIACTTTIEVDGN